MQEGVVLEGVQADDEIGDEGVSFVEMAIVSFQGLIVLVDHLHLHAVEDDVAVGDGAGSPFREQVARTREPRRLRHDLHLAGPCAHEQDQASPIRNLLNNACCPT